MKVRTRFGPSPTGKMHIGNVRTALFSYLYARSERGSFLLRIEDSDLERSEQAFTRTIMDGLNWLGLSWDEGPGKGADGGDLYFQSRRGAIYEKHFQQLIKSGLAYPCFCSEQELTMTRKLQLASGKPPRYLGTCSHLTEEAIQEKMKKGMKPALRFRVPEESQVEFVDFVKGPLSFQTHDLGDFIIRRANGTPSFIFCNAVDDALMGISHVIRGEDHVTNTPRQILVLNALGLRVPEYGHVSLILGLDGAKLSKRHGSNSLEDLMASGFLPEAIVNYLARLGHHYESNSLLNFNELSKHFQLKYLSVSPAKFDESQLAFWQKLAIQQMTPEAFWQWIEAFSAHRVPDQRRNAFIEAIKPNIIVPEDSLFWANIFFSVLPPFNEEAGIVLKNAGVDFFDSALSILNNDMNLNNFLPSLQVALQISGKKLFLPIRLALTGQSHGPELIRIMNLLGIDEVHRRLQQAREQSHA